MESVDYSEKMQQIKQREWKNINQKKPNEEGMRRARM